VQTCAGFALTLFGEDFQMPDKPSKDKDAKSQIQKVADGSTVVEQHGSRSQPQGQPPLRKKGPEISKEILQKDRKNRESTIKN